MTRRVSWAALALTLAVGAGTAGAQTSVETCIKYSNPGDASTAQYVDSSARCKDPGLAKTQVTITPATPTGGSGGGGGASGSHAAPAPIGGSGATATPGTQVSPTAPDPTTTPATQVPDPSGAHTTVVLPGGPDALPVVSAALTGAGRRGGPGAGAAWEMLTTPAGTALIIALAIGGAGLGIRKFGRDGDVTPKD